MKTTGRGFHVLRCPINRAWLLISYCYVSCLKTAAQRLKNVITEFSKIIDCEKKLK